MSEGFTASNGWRLDDKGCLRSPNGTLYASSSIVSHLRGFFQEERDHALGRWRDPELPEYVVYSRDSSGGVRVMNEVTADVTVCFHQCLSTNLASGRVATRYFAAQPVKTTPTVPGLYVRRPEAADAAPDLWQLSTADAWSTDASGAWLPANVSGLPDDLVRLVPEEAQ